MASPGGEDLIGWHVNRGWEQAADFFPASRFRERFNRPDVVQKVLDTLDEGQALEEANREARIRTDLTPIGSRLPPVIKIISPAEGASVREREVTIEYELRSPSGLPVDLVEVTIDGRPSRGIKRLDSAPSGTRVERQTVSIPAQDVQLGLIARAGQFASEPALVRLKWGATAASGPELLKPKLYGVIVGVSAYRDPSLALRYAAKDARDFAAALVRQKGALYRDIELKLLTDAQATTSEIKRALSWLPSTGREVSQEDASWDNGAFTKALLEGLPAAGRRGRADLTGKGVITAAQLNAWLADRVKELTRGAQHPVMILPATIPDFPLFVAAL